MAKHISNLCLKKIINKKQIYKNLSLGEYKLNYILIGFFKYITFL